MYRAAAHITPSEVVTYRWRFTAHSLIELRRASTLYQSRAATPYLTGPPLLVRDRIHDAASEGWY